LSALRLEFREPYPVYRSLRVPVWEDEEVVSIRRIRRADVEDLERALGELREVLTGVSEASKGQEECERLRRLADAVALFYKAPLIQEVSPVAPSPLKANVLMLLLGEAAVMSEEELRRVVRDPFEFSRVVAGRDFRKLLEGLRVAKLLSREVGELVYNLWIAFPADTRPGYNTSSLVAHLLLTSAIAWALNYGVDACRESTVRLAALLHDIGKAVDPEHHVEWSLSIADYLLRGLITSERLSEVKEMIKRHHEPGSALKRADEVAAEADRLDSLVKEVLGPKIDSLEKLLGKGRDKWEFWKELYTRVEELRRRGLVLSEDPVRELSETFLREVNRRRPKVSQAPREVPELKVVLIDVASIQEFVYKAQELKIVAAASSVVDFITQAHLLIYLRSNGVRVPPEAVVYSGGGNVLILVPERAVQRVVQLVEEYGRALAELGAPLGINCSVANFSSDYPDLSRTLGEGIATSKMVVGLRESLDQITSYDPRTELCRLCYRDFAVDHVVTPEGRVPACKLCKKLYELGAEEHFGSKWVAEIRLAQDSFSAKEAFGLDWKEASAWIMEIIAGHDPEELPSPAKLRDYSVVKFDGNAIGSFMLEAISFTDAVERSFRVDVAVKRAYFRALELLYDSITREVGKERARREVARVFLGTVYMGGDDGLLIVPAWVSVPLAQFLAEEFARELGLSRGLTVAVAGGHARMNVWSLIDCSSELMKKAKKVARASGSALVFDLYEGVAPSGKEAARRLTEISTKLGEVEKLGRAQGLGGAVESSQPYVTTLEGLARRVRPEIWDVLSVVLDLDLGSPQWTRAALVNAYSKAVVRCFLASREPGKGAPPIHEHLRSLRRAVLSSVREVARFRHSKELLYLYVCRQARSSQGKPREYYEKLLDLLNLNLFDQAGNFNVGGSTALADLIVLIKFVKGGAW